MSDQHDAAGPAPAFRLDNQPPPPPSPEAQAEAAWQRMQASAHFSEALLGHCRPRFLERAPIRLCGIEGSFRLYRDAQGRRRALRADEHDRAGIASLFTGAEGWLCRLWPASGGGWDDERASETLMHFNACIGVVDAAVLGFVIEPERLRSAIVHARK